MKTRHILASSALAAPIFLAALASSTPASAHVYDLTPSVAGPWQDFVFEPVGADWDDQFTLHLSAPALLEVTDGYQQGDIFDVIANGIDLGHTSDAVPDADKNYGNDFYDAFNSTIMSHGEWTLEAGDYTITGKAIATPFGNPGGAGIRVETIITDPTEPENPPTDPTGPIGPTGGVPEPASWALMILGFGGVGALLRRRSSDPAFARA